MAKIVSPGGCNFKPQPDNYITVLRTTPVSTVCPNFYLLDHGHGCGFSEMCSYCFLKDSDYGFKGRDVFIDKNRLLRELGDWIKRDDVEAFMANAGNMTDSLAFESVRPLWGEMIEFMRENAEKPGRPHCLLAVTKGGVDECAAFMERAPCRNVIISFSINSPEAARDHETGAAEPADRLHAAKTLMEKGWRVRVRIDPMIAGYDYRWVADEVAEIKPERVTLGTLRADPTLLPEVSEVKIFEHLEVSRKIGSISRYPRDLRMGMYRPVVKRLHANGISVGLCEETPDVWDELGLDTANKTCNCNPW